MSFIVSEITEDDLEAIISSFVAHCEECLDVRGSPAVDLKLSASDVASVSSALIGRQCALAIKFAQMPMAWDPHIAPLIMRAMIDCHITLRWILIDPDKRAREFMNYGLGLAKLSISHYEEALKDREEDQRIAMMIQAKKAWINSQALMPFVEVNIGSWHGSSVRQMCADIDDLDFYKYSYFPFSSCAHNTWDHISLFNAERCDNPMHKFHYVGRFSEYPIMIDMLYNAATYYTMSLDSFDNFYTFSSDLPSPLNFFISAVEDTSDVGQSSTSE